MAALRRNRSATMATTPDRHRPATVISVRRRVAAHLSRLYPKLEVAEIDGLADRVLAACDVDPDAPRTGGRGLPGADLVMLITYADSIGGESAAPLDALATVWAHHLAEAFGAIHLLPFFESSGDGGFSIVDHRRVAPHIGSWDDVERLASQTPLMVDFVCNHGSAGSEWFTQFRADEEPGRSYFRTADPAEDLRAVVRPRTHPLLTPVSTAGGTRYVWTTFSPDQVDFDFTNPDVLVEFCSIAADYVARGATLLRLDAIAYLWKRVGTTCLHLAETHEFVKLLRAVLDARDLAPLIVTETNVPHADNISYFGDGDEAHVVYNFTLAPLIVWSVLSQSGEALTGWLADLEAPPAGCTFLNFIATHDGLGVRPVEDLLGADELAAMIDATTASGGQVSHYRDGDVDRPYELNVSLADLLAGADGVDAARFIVAHAIMLAVQGIAGVYVHSVLVTPSDHDRVSRTGHARDINRVQPTLDEALDRLQRGWRGRTSTELRRLVSIRGAHDAFDPVTPQVIHHLHPAVVAIERRGQSGTVVALHNVSARPVRIGLSGIVTGPQHDLIAGEAFEVDHRGEMVLDPWQACWLVAMATDPA